MEGPHRCRRAPGVASVVRRDARTGNARAGNRRGVFTCSSTRIDEGGIGGDAVGILVGGDRRSDLINAIIAQHTSGAAHIVVVVVAGEGAAGGRYVQGVMYVRPPRRGTGVHQYVIPVVPGVQGTRAEQGIRKIGTRRLGTGNVHGVEIQVVVVRCCTCLVDAKNIRLRIAPQTDDVVAVGGSACVDLDAVDVGRGAAAPRHRQAVDEVLADRAGRREAAEIDTDHPTGESRETVGEAVHRVAAHHRPAQRVGISQGDTGHGCGMGDGVIGIGNRQVPDSVVRYRVVDIRYKDTADTSCRRGGGIVGGIHQVGHCIVRDRSPAPTMDAIDRLCSTARRRTRVDAARRGRAADGVLADRGGARRGAFYNSEEVGGERRRIGRRDSADGVVLTTDCL